jgi:hypothetical protein
MKMPITAQDVSTRSMGEHVYENRDPAQRAQELLADDLVELEQMLTRREEMMCRDAIFTLSATTRASPRSARTTSLTFDFARKAGAADRHAHRHRRVGQRRERPAGADRQWAELYAKLTGLVVTDMVFGGTAYRTFLDNTKVKAKMVNTSLIQTGVVAPQGVPDGARLVGTLYGGALRMWTYHEWYDDPDNAGTTTAMVPARRSCWPRTSCAPRCATARTRISRAPRSQRVPTLVEGRILPRSWAEKDPPPASSSSARARCRCRSRTTSSPRRSGVASRDVQGPGHRGSLDVPERRRVRRHRRDRRRAVACVLKKRRSTRAPPTSPRSRPCANASTSAAVRGT